MAANSGQRLSSRQLNCRGFPPRILNTSMPAAGWRLGNADGQILHGCDTYTLTTLIRSRFISPSPRL